MDISSLADDFCKDHLIKKLLKDPLYKIDKDGKIFSKLTLNGQGITDNWRELGYKKDDGYVRIRYKDEFLFIQRVVFMKFNGPIKPGYTIDHLDKNNSNNHPTNLAQKTQAENNKNKSKKYKKANIVRRVMFKLANTSDHFYEVVLELEKIYRKHRKDIFKDTSLSEDIYKLMKNIISDDSYSQKDKIQLLAELKNKRLFDFDKNKHIEKIWRRIIREWDVPSFRFEGY